MTTVIKQVVKGCRVMRDCIPHNSEVKHTVPKAKDGEWVATYNAKKDQLECNGNAYRSLSHFAESNHKRCAEETGRDETKISANGWAECKLKVDGAWFKMSNLSRNTINEEHINKDIALDETVKTVKEKKVREKKVKEVVEEESGDPRKTPEGKWLFTSKQDRKTIIWCAKEKAIKMANIRHTRVMNEMKANNYNLAWRTPCFKKTVWHKRTAVIRQLKDCWINKRWAEQVEAEKAEKARVEAEKAEKKIKIKSKKVKIVVVEEAGEDK